MTTISLCMVDGMNDAVNAAYVIQQLFDYLKLNDAEKRKVIRFFNDEFDYYQPEIFDGAPNILSKK